MSPLRKFWIVAAALLLLALPTALAGTASVPVLQVQDAIAPASAGTYILYAAHVAAMAPATALGVGGVLAFVAGGLLLFDAELPGFGVPLSLIIGLALLSAAVLLGGGLALKARRRPVVSGSSTLVGAPGVVLHLADDDSWAEVQGERWRVNSREPLLPGQAIRVRAVHGLTLDVQADPDTNAKGTAS